MKNRRVIVERDIGYKIYKLDDRFYLDVRHPICHSYATLAGAREAAYYGGYRENKY